MKILEGNELTQHLKAELEENKKEKEAWLKWFNARANRDNDDDIRPKWYIK